jgi:hypothetical protein
LGLIRTRLERLERELAAAIELEGFSRRETEAWAKRRARLQAEIIALLRQQQEEM